MGYRSCAKEPTEICEVSKNIFIRACPVALREERIGLPLMQNELKKYTLNLHKNDVINLNSARKNPLTGKQPLHNRLFECHAQHFIQFRVPFSLVNQRFHVQSGK